jgi:hypothetical protein
MQVRETVTAGENFASLMMSQSLNGAVAFYFL